MTIPTPETVTGLACIGTAIAKGWLDGPFKIDLVRCLNTLSGGVPVTRAEAVTAALGLMDAGGEVPDEERVRMEKLMGVAYDDLVEVVGLA